MTKLPLLIVVAVLATAILVGTATATYPRWGMIRRWSGPQR